MVQQNWFETLYEALDSENLVPVWDNYPMSYGESRRITAEIDGRYHTIVVYRETDGRYERPVHYDAGKIKS